MLRIVVPAYNEEARITKTIRAYSDYFGADALICVVANGCTDGTVAIVEEMMKSNENLQLVDVPFAIGKGGAVRVGLMLGQEEFMGFTDADGATPPESFARIVAACQDADTDAAIGSRWIPGSVVLSRQPLLRRGASRAFNLFARCFFGLRFADTQCGCKVFRRSALEKIISRLELSNFAFDIDILYALHRSKCIVREVAIVWADQPESKVRVAKIWFAMLIGLVRLRLRTGRFKAIPFLQLLARSNVIEVKESFKILVLSLAKHSEVNESKIKCWSDKISELGHDVTYREAASPVEKLKLFFWYFRSANVIYDLIVDADNALPDWFHLISTKAHVGPELFDVPEVDEVLGNLPSYFGFSQFILDRGRNCWSLMGGSPRLQVRLSPAPLKASRFH